MPSFALEVQRGSIPGAPNATEFSDEFMRIGNESLVQIERRVESAKPGAEHWKTRLLSHLAFIHSCATPRRTQTLRR